MTYKVHVETDGPVANYGMDLLRVGLPNRAALEPGVADGMVNGNHTHYLILSRNEKEAQQIGEKLVGVLTGLDFVVDATFQDDDKLN